jgi:hypothetical protein
VVRSFLAAGEPTKRLGWCAEPILPAAFLHHWPGNPKSETSNLSVVASAKPDHHSAILPIFTPENIILRLPPTRIRPAGNGCQGIRQGDSG